MITIEIKKLNDAAKLPTYGSEFAAGADLCSLEDKMLAPGERHLFKVGLALAIPAGVYGRIAPRSGLAFKHGIDVLAGVIDEDYRGELGVILVNHGTNQLWIQSGDKIAQIIFERYSRGNFIVTNELSTTVRGEGGYGSTDKKTDQTTERVLADESFRRYMG